MNNVGLAGDLAATVVRLARHLQRSRQSTALTVSQFSALWTLRLDGPMTVGNLAARERVRPPSMTRVVNGLDSVGLVARAPHATDKRVVIVSLTPAGTDAVDRAVADREQWLHAHLNPLDTNQLRTLADAARIIERILAASDYIDRRDQAHAARAGGR